MYLGIVDVLVISDMTKLPLTLVAIDNAAHALTCEAMLRTLIHITPDEVLIFTDDPKKLSIPGASYRKFIGSTIDDYNRCLWHEVPWCVHTSHYLIQQWDSWVINPDSWTSYFLSFDYIGAPWPWYKDNCRVGNGGFSLRSTSLARHLIINKHSFPPLHPEDAHICRIYRPMLETSFWFADEELAYKFSIEHGGEWADSPFGFHDCRNWPRICDPDTLQRLIHLGHENPYISVKPEFKQLQWKTRNSKKETTNV